ncbi:MAG: cyclohexanone monooxygenase, partial [Heyndrickxia sp.]
DEQIKQTYNQRIEKMRYSHAGFPYESRGKKTFDVSEDERKKVYEDLWSIGSLQFLYSFSDVTFNKEANEAVSEFIRSKIHEIVNDPEVAEILTPKGYPYAAERPLLDWGYLETFNRENVRLIDVKKNPIIKITSTGVETADEHFDLDNIVFATGYNAITGALMNIDIRGKNDKTLYEKWRDYPTNFLGSTIHGFPNMFMITGPGSPLPLSNSPVTIEQSVDWIMKTILYLDENNYSSIEPKSDSEQWWATEIQKVVANTLLDKANPWYKKGGYFIPYTKGFKNYRKLCEEIIDNGFKEFILLSNNLHDLRYDKSPS